MKTLGFTVRDMKSGFCLDDGGFFTINRCAAEHARLFPSYAEAEKVSNDYRRKDYQTIVIEVTVGYE